MPGIKGEKLANTTNLPEPWLSIAGSLGGAEKLYQAIADRASITTRSARRVCRGTGQLNFEQWKGILQLLIDHGLK